MANELVITDQLNVPVLLSDDRERQVKVKLSIYPSDEIRRKATKHQQNATGADVCVVLDVSHSMRNIVGGDYEETGETAFVDGQQVTFVTGSTSKLDSAVNAIENLVPMLRENDTLSLIVYDDNPHLIFKGLMKKDSERILRDLKKCYKYKGNTNISAALREARLLLNEFSQERPKRMIFLTDGQPVGDTEENGIREGKMAAEYNITIDALGFGDDFNYDFIQRIAEPSKGRTNIIQTPEDAEQVFSRLFRNTQDVLATNVELKLKFSQQVRVTDHYRGVPENMYLGKVKMSPDRTYTLNLGQLEANQRYDYYFLLTVPAQQGYTGTVRLFKATASYYIPGIVNDKEETSKDVKVEFTDKPHLANELNGDVEKDYTQAEIMKLLREAEDFQKQGDNMNTINRYEQIIQKYRGLGSVEDADMYVKVLEEFKASGKITLSEINAARQKSSSKVSDSGKLKPVLDESVEDIIYGKNGKGKGKGIRRGRGRR